MTGSVYLANYYDDTNSAVTTNTKGNMVLTGSIDNIMFICDAKPDSSFNYSYIYIAVPTNTIKNFQTSKMIKHPVYFYTNGGSGHGSYDQSNIYSGPTRTFYGKVPKKCWPLDPEKTNCTFIGWFNAQTGGTQVFPDITTFNNESKIYAHWESNGGNYRITLNANGGTCSASYITTDAEGGLNGVTLPTATKEASGNYTYTFDGWYTSSSGGSRITSSYVFTGNTTIYAQYTSTYHDPYAEYTLKTADTFNNYEPYPVYIEVTLVSAEGNPWNYYFDQDWIWICGASPFTNMYGEMWISDGLTEDNHIFDLYAPSECEHSFDFAMLAHNDEIPRIHLEELINQLNIEHDSADPFSFIIGGYGIAGFSVCDLDSLNAMGIEIYISRMDRRIFP